jgi:alpha-amylase
MIYKEIAEIAGIMRSSEPLRFGRLYYRPISGNGFNFGTPYGTDYTLAFSRLLYGREVLVAYNVSSSHRDDYVLIDAAFHQAGDTLNFLYGGVGEIPIRQGAAGLFVQLPLDAQQFVILE